jgi:hypothetical protein
MEILSFLKGYKIKLLGIVWAGIAVAEGLAGLDIVKSIDISNWVDNVVFGFGVFAGRDTLDSLFDKIKGEFTVK